MAKSFYIDALTKTNEINHRIRKNTLMRLMDINQKIFNQFQSPEKLLL